MSIIGSTPKACDLIDPSGNRLSELNHEFNNNSLLTLVANGDVHSPELFSGHNTSFFELSLFYIVLSQSVKRVKMEDSFCVKNSVKKSKNY